MRAAFIDLNGTLIAPVRVSHDIQEKQADRIASFVANDVLDAARWAVTCASADQMR